MVTYLRQDPTTNLMSPVEGVQVQPATQGQPVEVSAGGRIDPSLLPTTYDPKVDVIAAEAVQAGDLCYLLWENNARVIRKAVATAMATLSTVFVKDSYAQGASAAAYIHGVMTLVNPGTYTAADVGTSIYLSPTIPGYFQKSYPTASGQYTQRVAVITDVTESTLSCFFIGYLDRGRSAGAGLVDTDPTVTAHLTDHNNPHQVTAEQLGALVPSQIGAAGGIAPLGSNSMVPEANLPLSMWKAKSVRAVVTSNVNLAAPGATLDGLAMTAGDRVLLTAQTDLGAPGVYVWNSATTAMTRSTDADTAAELCESIWLITEGTQAHSVWVNTNKTIPTLGTTLLSFVRILDPGWTNPLTTSGDLLMATTGGAASRLAAGANGLVLTMVAGLPKWSELSVSGMTNPMTDQGDIVYGGINGVPTRLARGVAAQVLTVSNGGAPYWVAPTTGFANPMQDGGDLILGGSGGTATRLAAGSNGQVLTMVSGAVQWAAGGLTNPMTTHGDLLWGTDSGVPRRLGLGANGQVLTVVSGGLQWAAPTTGFANPMYFPGDLILGGTNGEGTRLAPGTTGQVLTITTEGPRWAGASGLTNPMTTVGDLIVGGTSGAAGRMSVGANGQVLTVVAGVPAWTAPSSGFSNPMTTAGDLIYGSTGGVGARLAPGTENQVLTMRSGFPTWVTGSGGSYSDPMTTLGDMLVRGASATERLAKGANGQVLTMVSGIPAWSNSGAALTNPMTTAGDIIVGGASGIPARLGKGSDGQVLTLASGAPTWGDSTGGGGTGGMSITSVDTIAFSKPVLADDDTYYSGFALPFYKSDGTTLSGPLYEASVPALTGATYDWSESTGAMASQVVENVLKFHACVLTGIHLKCTRHAADGAVEVAEKDIEVTYQGTYAGTLGQGALKSGTSDGLVTAEGVGMQLTYGGLDYDAVGNLYWMEFGRIRKLLADGTEIQTLAGSLPSTSTTGYTDATGYDARFGSSMCDIVFMGSDLYVADAGNHRIRKVTSTGVVTTYAGSGGTGTPAASAPNAEAIFNYPSRIATDGTNLYIVDSLTHGGTSCLLLRVGPVDTEIIFDTTTNFKGAGLTGVTFDPVTSTIYVSLRDMILQVANTTEAFIVAGVNTADRPFRGIIDFGEITDYDSRARGGSGAAIFLNIRGLRWANSRIYVNDWGTVRTVNTSGGVTTSDKVKTIYVHFFGSSLSYFAVKPTDYDTVVLGGDNSFYPTTYTPATLVAGDNLNFGVSSPGDALIRGWNGFALDETCPTFYTGTGTSKTGYRMASRAWASDPLGSWSFGAKYPWNTPYAFMLALHNGGFPVYYSSGAPWAVVVASTAINNSSASDDYGIYVMNQVNSYRLPGCLSTDTVPTVLFSASLSRSGEIPAPTVIPGIWGGNSSEPGIDGRPAFVSPPSNLQYDIDGQLSTVEIQDDWGIQQTSSFADFYYTGQGDVQTIVLNHGGSGAEEALNFTYDDNGFIKSIAIGNTVNLTHTASSGSSSSEE